LPRHLQFPDLGRLVLQARELFEVARDLILHPAQVLDGLAFARVEGADQGVALLAPRGIELPARALINQAAVKTRSRNDREVSALGEQSPGQNEGGIKSAD